MLNYRLRSLALLLIALVSAAAVEACGGNSLDLNAPDADFTLGDGGVGCAVRPCPSGAPLNLATCECEVGTGVPGATDATAGCPPEPCPPNSFLVLQGDACFCAPVGSRPDAGETSDATTDGPYDASPRDSGFPRDAPAFVFDAPQDEGTYPYDSSYCYYDYYGCGTGYAVTPSCTCELCPNTCPVGQMPGPSCAGCVACATTCPAGFDYGPSCGCVPHGTSPGPTPPDGGNGVTCLLEGYQSCNAGSWCELGTCPDGKTQYGCYCNADGTATCSLSCPVPPPCTIPGHTDCPPGRECVYGSCASDPSGDLLICQCSSYGDSGTAYCYTASCADGGPTNLPDAGSDNGGVTCSLEGYYSCSAGSWCSLGTCPDGTTQYGCFCNADGTSTCNLVCPTPPPCQIPGEGTCPYGTSCIYGCSGPTGTGLSCYCQWGGTANCSTASCSALSSDGG
jgi:hypothetical protein